jgi:hypothetical protein
VDLNRGRIHSYFGWSMAPAQMVQRANNLLVVTRRVDNDLSLPAPNSAAEAHNCLGESDPELTVVLPGNFASPPTGWSTSRRMAALFAGILILGSVISACLIIWGKSGGG